MCQPALSSETLALLPEPVPLKQVLPQPHEPEHVPMQVQNLSVVPVVPVEDAPKHPGDLLHSASPRGEDTPAKKAEEEVEKKAEEEVEKKAEEEVEKKAEEEVEKKAERK